MVFTKDKEWKCKECEIVFISPLRIRKHIISKHFSGPMCRCKYCGIYSKNEVSLEKHVSRRHKVETDKERSQWQITKHQAKAARFSHRSCPTPDYPPAPPPTPSKVESEQGGPKDKPADQDTRFMKRISDKLLKFKEITRKNARRALRFNDTIEVVTSGFKCEICREIFLQKHNALIHLYEVCLP